MTTSTTVSRRTDGITAIAIYHFVVAGIFALAAFCFGIPTLVLGIVGITEDAGAFIGMGAVALIGMTLLAFSLLNVVIGYGVWTLRGWARLGAMAIAVVSLLFVPLGTLFGAFVLWYLLKPEVAAAFEPSAS
jgi:hypothetical protein